MEDKMKQLEERLQQIEQRNLRVEADKAWETSLVRIYSLCVITYSIAAAVMYFIGVHNYLLNALVPAVGFFLSVQSLPVIKKWWLDHVYKDK
jgi:hypothetical protein